jgi:hypothetical protein
MKIDINKELQKIAKHWKYVKLTNCENDWWVECKNIDIESRSYTEISGFGNTPLQAIKNLGKY